jgi:hypothetical protein
MHTTLRYLTTMAAFTSPDLTTAQPHNH